MARKGLFGSWFCVLVVCFLVWPGLAQVPEPAQCLVSGIYNLVRLPESKDGESCWLNCFAEPDCHMAVVARPLTGPDQCLLVNCLNQSQYSYPRDPSAEIRVYPKTTTCNGKMHSCILFTAAKRKSSVSKSNYQMTRDKDQ